MTRPRIVIVGAGFGGLFAAQALARADADVTIVDRHNYHLFQPLLYQVATAGLPPSDVAWPIRSILRRQRNATVLLGEVTGIDAARRVVELGERSLPFDYLVVATGSTHSYFGHDDWQPFAPGLKSIDDATTIRRRILRAFEAAEMETDAARRERLLRFVIVGAGPTGVELAGTIAELARFTLAADFRRIDPRSAKIVLVEAGPRVLAAFKEPQSDVRAALAREARRRGARERARSRPATRAACRSAPSGSTARPSSGRPASRLRPPGAGSARRRIARAACSCSPTCRRAANVFVIGDAASLTLPDGRRVPGVAPAAKQQGRYVAKVIAARIAGRPPPPPFAYRDPGNLATIGRKCAVIEFPFLTLRGFVAWWVWGIAHIYFLVGVPSPVLVSLRWLWEYLTYGRGARLITGHEHAD